MRLLFDENLPPRLSTALAEHYPGSAHIRDLGLRSSSDEAIWDFAALQGYCIVSKDGDFHQRSLLHGHPPKVIWLRLGNCTVEQILGLLTSRRTEIIRFTADPESSILMLQH